MKQFKDCLIPYLSGLLLVVSLCTGGNLFAQDVGITVSGKVYDQNDQPMIGAAVLIKGTNTGAVTGMDGSFELVVPDEGTVIEVSSLGYQSQEVTVGKKVWFEFFLQEDRMVLDDVVVVAYGTQTRATVTGALSTVDTKELVKAPVASITNVLAGAVPGVSTVQLSGQPGSDAASIYVRGIGSLSSSASAPLVLVDGVERDFSQIDPNEIENFSVLKDAASTAVFGVRGANGVILITTKRGTEGKPTISVSSNNGLQQPISIVDQVGSYEYAQFWNTKMRNDNISNEAMYFSREAIEAYRTGSDPIMYPNVKWKDRMFNDVFFQTKNNINISGGGRNVRYFVSLGYLYQNGLLKQMESLPYNNNYKYNRYNYRANVDFDLSPTTIMKVGIGGNIGIQQEPRYIEGIGNPWVYATVWSIPMAGPGFVNGMRTLVPAGFIPSALELRDGFNTFYGYGYNQYYSTTLNIDAEIVQNLDFITEGLSLSLKGAYDNDFSLNKYRASSGVEYQTVYYKSYLEDNSKPQTDPDFDKTYVYVPVSWTQDYPLSYSEDYGRDRSWYLELKLNWARSFGTTGDHKVTAMFLYNQSRDYYPSSYAYIPRSYVGFVGRATYGYKGKYLVDVNIGYNGSENFAPGKMRYGAFPSASLGWVVSEEGFMKKQNVINHLKLRASYGIVGNDQTSSRFLYMPVVWSSSGSYSFGVNNPNSSEAFGYGTPGNENVSWETASKQNYGMDLEMFRNRLSLTADVFFEHRTGILLTPNNTPSIIATSLPQMNLGEVTNHGYELSLGWNDATRSGFNYYVTANVSFARNKIIFMDEVKSEFDYQNSTGHSVGSYSGLYKFERLYQYSDFDTNADGTLSLKPGLPVPNAAVYPGDAMYADLNNDGKVDGNDTMVTGYGMNPEYVFGLNAGFSWKGLNFSMQWTGATNVDRLMEIEYRIPFTNAGGRGLLSYFYEDCWTPENQDGTLPRAAETSESWNSQSSTLWLRDASYFRLKNVTLGYTFSGNRFLKSIGISSLNLSLSGYNLLTFTPLDFMDPEENPSNNGAYPLVKIYSFGLNINF